MNRDDTLPPGMATHTFGEHLKREREMRGVSLVEISAATRIGTRFLEAFESEQWDRLPGGVFNRGFVRAIARYLGLDEENLLAEYALAMNGQPETPAWTGAGYPPAERTNWVTWLLAAVVAIVVVGGAIALWKHFAAKRAAAQPESVAMTNSASPARNDSSGPASTNAIPYAAGGSSSGAGTSGQAARLELKLQAGKETTVAVVADGEKVFDGKMDAEATQQFFALERFEVSASDSSAVLLELNGQVMPPLGTPGQPGRTTLTREDLKKTAGGTH
jgi:cytoskeleton protein RodZ